MKYTLGYAKERLAPYSGVYQVDDLTGAINDAIAALAGLSAWECLRKTFRYSSVGPFLTLPQGSAGLVRVCVNGRPATVRGQDFRFVHSGPGDLSRPPAGFTAVPFTNVSDLGTSPLCIDPVLPFRIYAVADDGSAVTLSVSGMDPTGRRVSQDVTTAGEPTVVKLDTQVFQVIDSVYVPKTAQSYITLYAEDELTGKRTPVALYHPKVELPEFHHYHIPCIPEGAPVEILAEVRLDPLPLYRDEDPLPFDAIEPIEWMLNYNFDMQSGELDKAAKFQQQAVNWLKAREVTNDQVQTSIVINNVFAGSLGEDSMSAANI